MISLQNIIFNEAARHKVLGDEYNWRTKVNKYFDKLAPNGLPHFIHFANIPELSLNPKNKYKTPLGIYAHIFTKHNYARFATDRPYMFIFTLKDGSRVLDTNNYDEGLFNKDVEALKNKYPKASKEIMDQAFLTANFTNTISQFWNFTRLLSRELKSKKNDSTAIWNSLLRKDLGYDAIYDNGLKIIHPDEPHQIVVLNPQAIQVIELIAKKNVEDLLGGYVNKFSAPIIRKPFNTNDFLSILLLKVPRLYFLRKSCACIKKMKVVKVCENKKVESLLFFQLFG